VYRHSQKKRRKIIRADVRCGSEAEARVLAKQFRFATESGRTWTYLVSLPDVDEPFSTLEFCDAEDERGLSWVFDLGISALNATTTSSSIGPDEVRARYGVDPKQVPDFIALRGDPSDKVPGAPDVGAVGAATLLQRYGSLEVALKAGRFPAHAESLRLFATMNKKAPLPSLRSQKPTWDRAAELVRTWELNQLARRLEEIGLE
jgi:hypothetical protein